MTLRPLRQKGTPFCPNIYPLGMHCFSAKAGWNRVIQHVADEPIDPSADDYRILSGIVRKRMPGVPLVDAVIHTGVAGAVDIWVPTNKEYELNQEKYEFYRKCGELPYPRR